MTKINRIFKPKKYDNFTVVPSYIFRYKNITLGSTGLYCFLFSHTSDFEITVSFICNHFKEGKDAINNKIKELISYGFLKRELIRIDGKFAGYNYHLNAKPKRQKPKSEKPLTVKPQRQKPQQSNINNNINNISNNNKVNKTSKSPKKEIKASDFDDDIIKCFNHVILLFPEKYRPQTKSQKINWVKCIDQLNRLDKYSPRKVYYITMKALKDDFWSQNFYSILKLRQKNKQGVKYVDVFFEKFGKELKGVKI